MRSIYLAGVITALTILVSTVGIVGLNHATGQTTSDNATNSANTTAAGNTNITSQPGQIGNVSGAFRVP
jgi:hypothetical protein